jgi:hypothetical protein
MMKILVALFGLVFITGAFATDADVTDDATDVEIVAEDEEFYDEEEYTEESEEESVADVADVSGAVIERVACSDIKAQIDELRKITVPDDATLQQLKDLQIEYRTNCARSGAGRRTSGRAGYLVETSDVAIDVSVSEPVVTVVDSTENKTDVVTPDVSLLTPEQMKQNLESGLCADGTKPNRFGCCGDEIFKDMGNTVFACCPKSGGDCYPPIK